MFQPSSDLEFCTARTATMLRDTSPTAPEERSLGPKYKPEPICATCREGTCSLSGNVGIAEDPWACA